MHLFQESEVGGLGKVLAVSILMAPHYHFQTSKRACSSEVYIT
jgi:hypothetical protein